MARSRVLSFMSTFGGSQKDSPRSSPSPQPPTHPRTDRLKPDPPATLNPEYSSSREQVPQPVSPTTSTPSHTPPATRGGRPSSRPGSLVYQPPLMDTSRDTPPELLPIFTFLNSHANKLYQEGYFLKLNDLDISGKPNIDRNWTECFAQLVGTVLSLWDAAALDAAGQDGEVAPTFINLADASIKMIETLPTRNQDVQPLQNVLSISTAGKNRYLLHFNSLHSLTQWTAGIRLAMFEHASLQELYTGSLIAGKGKQLNSIRTIMERSKFRTEDWARVRFGAGTPWRRCWCVIEPPDVKDFQKLQRSMKKRSAYDRPKAPRGYIKFYDTKKTKKAIPIATITDAYSAYAIYPQSKPLIDQSTLVKVEGRITIHSLPESKTEGFVFVMPEAHPAVSGFEIMLRWLFPVYDCFNLYGRPTRLIADTLDTHGLMFAMPQQKRYGYVEIIDVAGLIHTDGSNEWSEREWRRKMKELTSRRMEMMRNTFGGDASRLGSMRGPRISLPSRSANINFSDDASIHSSSSMTRQQTRSAEAIFATPQKSGTAPSGASFPPPANNYHSRAVSESVAFSSPNRSRHQNDPYQKDHYQPSRLSTEAEIGERDRFPQSSMNATPQPHGYAAFSSQNEYVNSGSDYRQPAYPGPEDLQQDMRSTTPPAPVVAPPAFAHQAGDKPPTRPNTKPDTRRANNRMSNATLSQMVDATGRRPSNDEAASAGAIAAWKNIGGLVNGDSRARGVNEYSYPHGAIADHGLSHQGMVADASSGHDVTERQSREDQNREFQSEQRARSASAKSVSRKPVPSQAIATQIPSIGAPGPSGSASQSSKSARIATDIPQNPFTAGSYQDTDTASTGSPDYASSRKSTDSRKSERSVSRPRTGVLKTVGDPEINKGLPPIPGTNVPAIDFGPTPSLAPRVEDVYSSKLSNQSYGAQNQNFQRSAPGVTERAMNEVGPSFHGQPNPKNGIEGKVGLHSRSLSYENRAMAWRPGAVVGTGRQSPGPAISAEDFVQQRAAMNRASPTGIVPQRSRSSGYFPTDRSISGDWSNGRNTPPRPSSRGSLSLLAQQPEVGSHLSAHEQEYLAKMTGSPLLNMTPKIENGGTPVGLVGAIQAREQEKKNMKDGVSGQMVQHAISQRQRQAQMQAQQAAHLAYGYQQPLEYSYGVAPASQSATWSPQNAAPTLYVAANQAQPQLQGMGNAPLQYSKPYRGQGSP